MRKNLLSAIAQTGASVGLALLSIAIFRFLSPDQVAFLRQHYFVPFALVTAFAPANQNYLRSILFSEPPSTDIRGEMNSLAIVQLVTGALLLIGIILSINRSGATVTWLNTVALMFALLLVLARTITTSILEFRGNYFTSIVLNNFGGAIPYISAFSFALISSQNSFFLGTIALNFLNIVAVLAIASRLSDRKSYQFANWTSGRFQFNFGRYLMLSQISLGSVVVYQGVEFFLYNHTQYNRVDIANYGLAFSTLAIIRQIILTAVQPLERLHNSIASVNVPGIGNIKQAVAIEITIYLILAGAILLLPPIIRFAFPNFAAAATFMPPLVLGVLGSAIQQIYSVRMIALARTGFLGSTQIALASASIIAVAFLNSSLSMINLVWILSSLIWLRGCIVIPLYAEFYGKKGSAVMWVTRLIVSTILPMCFF